MAKAKRKEDLVEQAVKQADVVVEELSELNELLSSSVVKAIIKEAKLARKLTNRLAKDHADLLEEVEDDDDEDDDWGDDED